MVADFLEGNNAYFFLNDCLRNFWIDLPRLFAHFRISRGLTTICPLMSMVEGSVPENAAEEAD